MVPGKVQIIYREENKHKLPANFIIPQNCSLIFTKPGPVLEVVVMFHGKNLAFERRERRRDGTLEVN